MEHAQRYGAIGYNIGPDGSIRVYEASMTTEHLQFALEQQAYSSYVDMGRTSLHARTVAFLPGYVERVEYFVWKKLYQELRRLLARYPTWPDATVVIPFGGREFRVTATRADLERLGGVTLAGMALPDVYRVHRTEVERFQEWATRNDDSSTTA